MGRLSHGTVIDHRAFGVGIGEQATEDGAIELKRLRTPEDQLDADRPGAGRENLKGLRVATVVDQKALTGALLRRAQGRQDTVSGRLLDLRRVGSRDGSHVVGSLSQSPRSASRRTS